LDTAGVSPERLPGLLLDNLRVRRFRLDHVVDPAAAAYVRAHLEDFAGGLAAGHAQTAAAPKPAAGALVPAPGTTGQAAPAEDPAPEETAHPAGPPHPVATAGRPAERALATLRVQIGGPCTVADVAVGEFDVALPPITAPVFLRLGRATSATIDAARAALLLVARPALTSGRAGWADGPGLVVAAPVSDTARLRSELKGLGHALRALDDETIAASYLELCGPCESNQRPRPEGAPAGAGAVPADRDVPTSQGGVR
jgi:hypothetical protein